LEAIVGLLAANRRDEVAPDGVAMVVEEALKRWLLCAHME
jgi:hypothetical protein